MSATVTARPDPWLEQFFPGAVVRVVVEGKGWPVPTPEVKTLLGGAVAVFAYAKVPVAEVEKGQWLSEAGFYVVDTLLTFEKSLGKASGDPPPCVVRPARPEDAQAVSALAARAFHTTRFHLDPAIPYETAAAIKGAWAGNFFNGERGDAMLMAEVDGDAAGFLLLVDAGAGVAVIDEIAVDQVYRGRGVASALLDRVRDVLPQAAVLRAGTQAANHASLVLYQRRGFVLRDAQYVFHSHHTPGDAA